MPTSHCHQLNEIVDCIRRMNPRSLLDIGVGFGKFGFLAREYLELWDGREEYGKWHRTIHGIEGFEGYITPVHKLIYDEIFIGDASAILSTSTTHYDLILLIDVLEHFDYETGIELLQNCARVGRNTIVSTPKDIGDQEDAFGNVFEIHRFQWQPRHFEKLPNRVFLANRESIICCFGEDTLQKVRKLRRRQIRNDFRNLLGNLQHLLAGR